MEYASPSTIHLYSSRTRVSLEMPPGWQEADDGDRQVIYAPEEAFADDPGTRVPPKFVVKVVDVLLADQTSYLQLAQQLLDTPMQDLERISHETIEVDSFDGVLDVFTYHEPEADGPVTQLQVFVQVGQVVFSMTGLVDPATRDAYLPVFRQAVESVRFIIPWKEVGA